MNDEFFVKFLPSLSGSKNLTFLGRVADSLYWLLTSNELLKSDLNFNLIWYKKLTVPSLPGNYVIRNVSPAIGSNQEIILSGYHGTSGTFEAFAAKMSSQGNIQWNRIYESTQATLIDHRFTIKILSNNNYVIQTSTDRLLVIDNNGNVISSKQLLQSAGVAANIFALSINGNNIVVHSRKSTNYLVCLAILDNSLNFIEGFRYQSVGLAANSGFPNSSIVGNRLICSFANAFVNEIYSGFISIDFASNYNPVSGLILQDEFHGQYHAFQPSSGNFYWHVNDSGAPLILLFDNTLNLTWAKKLQNTTIDTTSSALPEFVAEDDFLLLTPSNFSGITFNPIVKVNTQMSSACISTLTETFSSTSKTITKQNDTFATAVVNINIAIYGSQVSTLALPSINQICPQTYDLDESIISTSHSTIGATSSSTALITVQLKDYQGTNLSNGGETVVISTTAGTIGATTDNNDGTYTATLTSSINPETAILSFSLNGEAAANTIEVSFIQTINLSLSTISADPNSINADGASTSQISVQLKDYAGNNMATGGENIVISTSVGSIDNTSDNGNGGYTATLTSSINQATATLTFTLNGATIPKTVQVDFIRVVNSSLSTISASPMAIGADGISTTTITVQLKDFAGTDLTTGGETVAISTNRGTLGTTTDNGDGTYIAILTSSTTWGTALLSFTVNGENATNIVEVVFNSVIPIIIQSPHVYLQSAGSTGSDGSTSGIHLRWLLKKDLINHIPKGNLAGTTFNYNKPNDFVTLYKAPYIPEITTIDFNMGPQVVENRNALWVYKANGQTFYLYFRNKTKYTTVRSSFDPLTQHIQFIQNYGSDLLEFQTSSDLFFAVQFTSSSTSTVAKVESEILSVEGSTEIQEKQITARKAFIGSELSNARLITENGKSLRFRPTNCHVTNISVELYSVFSNAIEDGPGWSEIGQFALSETDNEVFERLEPTLDMVNGTWPRYNDGALVNSQNYKDKWNQQSQSTQSNIKQTVQDYVSLSDNEDNPLALETFSFDTTPPPGANPEDNTFEIPNLVLLQQAAMDYHVARMLGMGHLDISAGVQNNDSFVYMMKYDTLVTLEYGQLIPESTEHRFMTPPTSRNDQKLPTPIDLKVPVPGVFLKGGVGESPESLTDENGYTLDGKSRYITLYADKIEDLSRDLGFYNVTTEFNLALETTPVYAGIEYKKTGDLDWKRPELPNTPDYQNLAPSGQTPYNETVPLPIPDEGTALFVHRETESGEHIYGSYGVNWFSRITRSVQEHALTTTILLTNTLLPPSDRSALLIVEEQPLMLTTANEQVLRSNISGSDKTLIRLMFNYNSDVELQSYRISDPSINPLDPNSIFPDSEEVFADEVELFFRNSMPTNVSGKATNVSDHPTNEILSVITTSSYTLQSTEETITPTISLSSETNFIGGVLVLEEVEFIIHEVDTTNPNAPTFTVYKKQISDKLQNNNQPNVDEGLEAPIIKTDGLFLAVENLQNTGSWGTPNPHPLKVQIGNNWPIHREVITRLDPDGNSEEFLQKTRGIWDNATIEKVEQAKTVVYNELTEEYEVTETEHRGQYKATFGSAILANHPQSGGANPVQWYKGIMRVHTISNPNGERRSLEVFKIENIGTSNALIVYFTDKNFGASDNEEIQTGGAIQVNFYPGYRIYLYANAAAGISENTVIPQTGEGIKYSCFGFRSLNNAKSYYSRIAIPTVMFAQEVIVPLVPQLPTGALYATRPDAFGKATYALTTQFDHTPHGILYYRSDDDAILNALYIPSSITTIKQELEDSDSSFLANRWQNLLGFDYDYPTNSFQTDGLFGVFPETAEGYRLPNPDNPSLFAPTETPGSLTPGEMIGKIKDAVLESFVPLTEVPLLYEYINGVDYDPVPKKQVIRDRNGNVLKPTDTDFDIAPMARKIGANQVRFVDFTLDGTSNNLYFYSAKELSNTLQMSDFSPILGPIKLVNTNPPKRPAIRQMVPILEDIILGIPPQMEVSVNAYPKVENIKKLSLHRALNLTDALSIRTMDLIKEIDLEALDVLDGNIWKIADDFQDLAEVPFGDPLYYRVIVSREIEYPDKNDPNVIITEYMPSEPSKLVVTTIVENTVPDAPSLSYTAATGTNGLTNVVLQWDKTVYKGTYYIYKMNPQGQWVKIFEMASNDDSISVPLQDTDWGTDILPDENEDGEALYHHFKVIAANTANVLSRENNILTVPQSN